jgi:hypothetical protein
MGAPLHTCHTATTSLGHVCDPSHNITRIFLIRSPNDELHVILFILHHVADTVYKCYTPAAAESVRDLRLVVFGFLTDSHDPQNMSSDVTLTLEAAVGRSLTLYLNE